MPNKRVSKHRRSRKDVGSGIPRSVINILNTLKSTMPSKRRSRVQDNTPHDWPFYIPDLLIADRGSGLTSSNLDKSFKKEEDDDQ